MRLYRLKRIKEMAIKKMPTDNLINHIEVYQLRDGSYLKIFSPLYLKFFDTKDGNLLEDKILDSEYEELTPEIIKPSYACFENGEFNSYVTLPSGGIDFVQAMYSTDMRNQFSLKYFNAFYRKLESAVDRANKAGVVFPDLCTEGNIHFTQDGQIKFIDYDGLQIGDREDKLFLSTALGEESQYNITKYRKNNLYTSELDKKSIIIHYFAYVFGIDLTDVGQINSVTNKVITVEEKLRAAMIFDDDIIEAVSTAFKSTGQNSFITPLMQRYEKTHMLLPTEKSKILVPQHSFRY